MEKPSILKRVRAEDPNEADGEKQNMKSDIKCIYPTLAFSIEPETAVAKRNERERNRVRLVNEGFSCLRQRIPFIPQKKKLSKVETLRYAVAYIKHLQCVIQEHDAKIVMEHAMERRRSGKCGTVRMVSTRAQERWNYWAEKR